MCSLHQTEMKHDSRLNSLFHFFPRFPFSLVLSQTNMSSLNMPGLWNFHFLIWETSKKMLPLERLFFNDSSVTRGVIVPRFCHASTYHPRTHGRDGSFLSLASKALLPEILFHSSHICQLAHFCNASLLPFNSCHVWIHSPLFFHPHNTSTGPQCSSHRVATPLTASSTPSGLAGEKTQAAGGGPGLPESPAALLSHWHQGSAVERLYTLPFREDIEEEGRQQPTGGNVALAIWRQRNGSTRHHGENKQVPGVPDLPLWPTSKHTECVCVCVCSTCTCADEELGLSNTQLYFVQGYGHLQGGCNGEKERERETRRERDLLLQS